jgi:dihydrofolate reductase
VRKLVAVEFLSLDGVYQAPGDPNEDTEGGFTAGGWQRPYVDEDLGRMAAEGMAATGVQLFGRKTYQIMASYWPNAPADDPYAKHLNSVQKYVVSRTLRDEDVTWGNTTLLRGDPAEEIGKLKDGPGDNISVLGSGKLVQWLLDHDLVDELSLWVFPIVLGGGKRLFRDDGQVRTLTLVDSKTTRAGGLALTYRPAR